MSQFFVSNSFNNTPSFPLGVSTPRANDEDLVVDRAPISEEKIRSAMPIPAFLPYLDPLQTAGETTEIRLMGYRQMLADPNVKAAFLGKVFAIMGQEPTIRPWSKKRKRDRKIASFVEWNLKHCLEGGMSQLIWEILHGALICGYSVCEKIWDEPEGSGRWRGKRVLRKLKSKDVDQDLVPIIDAYQNIIAIRGLRYNTTGKDWSPREFVIFRHLGLFGNPLGMSDFRAAYSRWWFLDTVLKLRALACDKRALPVIWAQLTQETQRSAVETALTQIRYRNWLAVPAGVQVAALDMAGQSETIFSNMCRDLKEDIFLAISLATLQALTGGAGQQRGNSLVHADTANLGKMHLLTCITNLLNDRHHGLIRDIVDLNFADVEDYPYAAFPQIEDGDLVQALQVDNGLKGLGWKFNLEELEERYARKFETNPKLAMPDPQQGGMPGMPGMGAPQGDDDGGGAIPLDAPNEMQMLG